MMATSARVAPAPHSSNASAARRSRELVVPRPDRLAVRGGLIVVAVLKSVRKRVRFLEYAVY